MASGTKTADALECMARYTRCRNYKKHITEKPSGNPLRDVPLYIPDYLAHATGWRYQNNWLWCPKCLMDEVDEKTP